MLATPGGSIKGGIASSRHNNMTEIKQNGSADDERQGFKELKII